MTRPDGSPELARRSRLLLAGLLVAVVVLVASGVLVYRNYAASQRPRLQQLLSSVARARQAAINSHVRERVADAWLLSQHEEVRRAVLDSVSPPQRAALAATLRLTAAAYGYQDIGVLRRDGSEGGRLQATPLVPEARAAIMRAMEVGAAQVIPLHRTSDGRTMYGLASPIRVEERPGAPVVGAVYLALDLRSSLLPVLRDAAARRRGLNSVLLQLDRLHASGIDIGALSGNAAATGAARAIIAPVPRDARLLEHVAVLAGEQQLLEGVGPSGPPAFGTVIDLDPAPWRLLVSIERADAEESLRTFGLVTSGIVLLLVALTAITGRAVWLQQQREFARRHGAAAERALRVLATSIDGFVLLDESGRFIEVNEALARMTGYTQDELLQRTLADVRVFASGETVSDVLGRVHARGSSRHVSRWRRQDGTPIDLNVSAASVTVDGRRQVEAFVRDISDELRMRERLRRSNRLYALLNQMTESLYGARTREAAFDAVCRLAVLDGDFRLAWVGAVDPGTRLVRAVAWAGEASRYVDGLVVSVDPDDQAGRGPTGRAIREARPIVFNDFATHPGTAFWHGMARENGLQSVVAMPVVVDGAVVAALTLYSGEPGFFEPTIVTLLSEITRFLGSVIQSVSAEEARVAEQRRRRETEDRFRNLFHASPVPMLVLHESLVEVRRVNRALGELLGWTADELPTFDAAVARFFPDVVQRAHAVEVLRFDMEELQAGERPMHSQECTIAARDGSRRIVQPLLSRVGDEVLVAFLDYTDLRSSQRMLREAQSIARLGSWGVDLRHRKWVISDELHDILDLPVPATGTRDDALEAAVAPGDRARIEAGLMEAGLGHRRFDATVPVVGADGRARQLRLSARVELDELGQPLRAVGSAQDVTEQWEAARQLERYRDHLEELVRARTAALEEANATLVTTQTRLAALLAMTQRASTLDEDEILQLGLDEAVRLTGSRTGFLHQVSHDGTRIRLGAWSSGVPWRDLDLEPREVVVHDRDRWSAPVATRAPVIVEEPQRIVHPDAPDRPLEIGRCAVVPILEGGAVRMLLGVADKGGAYDPSDVQELQLIAQGIWSVLGQRRADIALAEAFRRVKASDERFAFAMEASSEGIWDWDLTTGRISVSSVYCAMLGYPQSAFPMREDAWRALVHPEDVGRLEAEVRAAMWRERAFEVEFRMRAADGEYRWVVAHGQVVERDPDGGPRRLVGTQADLTTRKRREEELRVAKEQADAANRAKSAFLAVMSHEIRTPLNGVLGMAEVLAQSDLAPREADAVATIRRSATNLLILIDDILDFSKIEAGRIELELLETDLDVLVEDVHASLRGMATARGDVDLLAWIAPDVPTHVMTDATRLRQILLNLGGNAVKFSSRTPGRRGQVTLRVEMDAASPLALRFVVRDNGIGMSAETMSRIFTTFSQGEISTTRRFGGTGLGLAICKRLAELFNGRIEVASAEGEGATFTVTLPMREAPARAPRPLPDLADVHCVLVPDAVLPVGVEDMRAWLARGGAVAEAASSYEDGVARALALGPLAVLVVPGETGPRDARVRHVVLTPGRQRAARVLAPNLVTLDREALRGRSLLQAVAIAAGRASPEIFLDPVDGPEVARATAPTVEAARAAGRLILVAEDDEINTKVILQQLDLLGYAAEVAPNGRAALERWRRGGYAMVLTDLHMPDMDGYSLARAIRREAAGPARVPVLALTANALLGEEARAREAGMDDFLTKPVRLQQLKATIERWMPAAPEPVLDVAILKDLVGDDEAVVQDFLGEYRSALAKGAGELEAAVARDDLAAVAAIVHRLKSSSRSVGAMALGTLCAAIEQSARAQDPAALRVAGTAFPGLQATTTAAVDAALGVAVASPDGGGHA